MEENTSMKLLILTDLDPHGSFVRERLQAMEDALFDIDYEICDTLDVLYPMLTSVIIRRTGDLKEFLNGSKCSLKMLNDRFKDYVRESGCNHVLLCTLDTFSLFLLPDTINTLQYEGIKITCIFGDDEFMLNRHAHWVDRFDLNVAYVKWCADYYNNIVPGSTHYMPWGSTFNGPWGPPKEKTKDVIFIGGCFKHRITDVQLLAIEFGDMFKVYGPDEWLKYIPESSYGGLLNTTNTIPMTSTARVMVSLMQDHLDGKPHMNGNFWNAVPVKTAVVSTEYDVWEDYGFENGKQLIWPKGGLSLVGCVYYALRWYKEIADDAFNYVSSNFAMKHNYRKLFERIEAI